MGGQKKQESERSVGGFVENGQTVVRKRANQANKVLGGMRLLRLEDTDMQGQWLDLACSSLYF